MKRAIVNPVKQVLRAMWRAAFYLAVASKLIVPIGYMPAALADDGPIRLCDAGMPLTSFDQHSGAPSGKATGHAAHESGKHAPSGGNPSPHEQISHEGMPGQPHDHDDDAASHHQWERCSLGGLASLAAVASEWQVSLAKLDHESAVRSMQPLLATRLIVAFRSRAPPFGDS